MAEAPGSGDVPAVIGIDGGGTRSTLVVLREGQVLLRLEGGGLLLDPNAPQARAGAIAGLVQAAAERVPLPLPASALCCGLAGAGQPADRALLAAALRERGVARVVEITTDAEAALCDSFGEGEGVLVIAGTGSVVWARAPNGQLLRAGGWGPLLGDEGSGYAIGRAALRAVARASDGRSSDASLIAPVLACTGASTAERLVRWAAAADKAAVAALAPVVFETGGEAAASIVRAAAAALADQLAAVLRRSGGWAAAVPLALTGGLVAPGRPLRAPLLEALSGSGVGFALREQEVDGARGAAQLALRVGTPGASV